MITSYERAVELSPSDAGGLTNLGIALALAGRSEEAIANLRRSMRLSPNDRPLAGGNAIGMALAHFGAGRYEDAVDWAERGLQYRLMNTFGWRLLAVSYAHLGRLDEARSAATEVLRSYPEFSVSHVAMEFAAADPAFLEQFLDGLRKAGVPEE
jgi:Flp pilus assembly protein TadD